MSTLDELTAKVEIFFQSKGYNPSCKKRYRQTWANLRMFMNRHAYKEYTSDVGTKFLKQYHGDMSYEELSDRQKERYRHVDVLTNLVDLGYIKPRVKDVRQISFDGDLGYYFKDFIEEHRRMRAPSTIMRYEERIFNLYQFLKTHKATLKDFDVPMAMSYLKILDETKDECDRNNIIMTTRVLLRYLCDKRALPMCLPSRWMSVFQLKKLHAPKLPSVYTAEEVEKILRVIDRAHPQGKRDYAMALLAARCGLRISDIIGLRFCNLIWEENKITLYQQKTGKKVSLPISEEVGTALIDYIRHGRPDIDLPYVFLTAHAPYKELSSNIMCRNIADWMRYAGIDSTGRKSGPHALRHSLATNLLGVNNPLPVISEILGHSNTESTKVYTRVHLDMLRECALDVPFVPSSFYDNLYG